MCNMVLSYATFKQLSCSRFFTGQVRTVYSEPFNSYCIHCCSHFPEPIPMEVEIPDTASGYFLRNTKQFLDS